MAHGNLPRANSLTSVQPWLQVKHLEFLRSLFSEKEHAQRFADGGPEVGRSCLALPRHTLGLKFPSALIPKSVPISKPFKAMFSPLQLGKRLLPTTNPHPVY